MSISPPSDIVLDVARAADPVRLGDATAKLTRIRPGDAAAFAGLIDQGSEAASAAAPPASDPVLRRAPGRALEAFQQFEAMTLATMIESAMPDDATSAYGTGTAGNVWKSMMAEELGKQMALAGGIGLASQLERSAAADLLGVGDTSGADAGSVARSLIISNLERGALRSMRPDTQNETDSGPYFEDAT